MTIKKRILLLIIPLFLLSGCGSLLLTANFGKENPTSLQVNLVNMIPENHYTPTSPHTINNAQAVQQLYNTVQALPHQASGSIARSCPVDSGLQYQLVFSQGQTVIQKATYHPGGCPSVVIGKSDVRVPDKSFAQTLAQTIGLPVKELFPTFLFSCNTHSPCPSPTP